MSLLNQASRRMLCTPPRATATPPSKSAGTHSSPASLAQGRKDRHHIVCDGRGFNSTTECKYNVQGDLALSGVGR